MDFRYYLTHKEHFFVNAIDGQCGIIPSQIKLNYKTNDYGLLQLYVIIWLDENAILYKNIFFSGTITPRGCGFVIGYTGSNSDDEFFIGDICQVSFCS